MCRPRSSTFTRRKSNKQEEKVKYQSTELKRSRFNFKWNGYARRWGGCDRENHYNSMMPPEKMKKEENGWCGGWGWSGGGEVRQGGIDLLPLYRNARQVLSDPSPNPPPFSFILSPSKVGLFPDLSDLGETTKQSSPVSRLGLSPSPSPEAGLFSESDLWFSANQVHCIPRPSTTVRVPSKIVVGRGRGGGLCCCIGWSEAGCAIQLLLPILHEWGMTNLGQRR